MKRVLVGGGGIAGLLTAWALSRRGIAVTVFEQGPLPNPKCSSFDEHRIVRPAGERAWVTSACSSHGSKLAPAMAEAVAQVLAGEREAAGIPAWAAPL